MKEKGFKGVPAHVWAPACALLLVWLMFGILWRHEFIRKDMQERSDFRIESRMGENAIAERLLRYDGLFSELRLFFAAHREVRQADFSRWIDGRRVFALYPEVGSVHVLVPMPENEKIALQRNLGVPPPTVTASATTVPQMSEVSLLVARHPSGTDSPADIQPGMAVEASTLLHQALKKTAASGAPIFLARYGMSQAWSGWVVPIYKNALDTHGGREGTDGVLAWIVVPVDMGRAFTESLATMGGDLAVEMTASGQGVVLRFGGEAGNWKGLDAPVKMPEPFSGWSVSMHPSKYFIMRENDSNQTPQWILLSGLAMGAIASLMVWVWMRPEGRVKNVLRSSPEMPEGLERTSLRTYGVDSVFDPQDRQGRFLARQVLAAALTAASAAGDACKSKRWDVARRCAASVVESAIALHTPRLFLVSQKLVGLLDAHEKSGIAVQLELTKKVLEQTIDSFVPKQKVKSGKTAAA